MRAQLIAAVDRFAASLVTEEPAGLDPVDPTPAPPAPTVAPTPPPPVVPVAEPAPAVPDPPKPTPKARPKPAPKPTPKPTPKPSGGETAKLIQRGWDKVDTAPSAALSLFQQALSSSPSSAEAHYGRGYALMRLDRKDEAVSAYCKAISLGDTLLRREIRSVMQQNGLACP
jgi:outer membrane biosynthesis protein TonB